MPTTRRRAMLLLATLLAVILAWRWAMQPAEDSRPAHLAFDLAPRAPARAVHPVEVNTADSAAFEQLPGVGPRMAARIVRYRQQAGYFRSLAHFRTLRGMDSLYPHIAPWVHLDSSLLPAPVPTTTLAAQPPAAPRDINAVTEEELLAYHLLPPHLARRVVRYGRARGGYQHISELRRVYGLTDAQYLLLSKYFFVAQRATENPPHTPIIPSHRYTVVDINQADSAALEALPGLGPVLSRRVVQYRSRLGFYHQLSQLNEVYGMRDSLLQLALPYLRVSDSLTHYPHVHINSADVNSLAAHPYIRYNLAKRLVAYRTQHGSYRSVNDLYQLFGLDSTTVQRLLPYIRLD